MIKILVIDDEEQIRALLSSLFEMEGYEVIAATDGKDGMTLFDAHSPDLVITDIVMPDMEGMEVIRTLKKKSPSVPVIAISGGGINASHEYLYIASKIGAAKIFEKPVRKKVLLEAVKELLADN